MLLGSICAISALRRRAYSDLGMLIKTGSDENQCRDGLAAGAAGLAHSVNSSSGATRRYSITSM